MKTAQYTKSLTVALRQEIYDRIKAITDESGISMADWIREASEKSLVEKGSEGGSKNETECIVKDKN
jgi:predicted DNA-binding protein